MATVSVVEQQRVVGLASVSEVKRKTDTSTREAKPENVAGERK